MLTQLGTVKARVEIVDNAHDDFLTRAIAAVSSRFDRECNRTFARTVDITQEFAAEDNEVIARCYPIENVTKFELKASEDEGWVEQVGVAHLVRQACVVSMAWPFSRSTLSGNVARVTYTGGYVLPGAAVGAGQTALPADLESAAVEQVAVWYQQREKLGLIRHWPSGGVYMVFTQLPLLPQVSAMLRPYRRWTI